MDFLRWKLSQPGIVIDHDIIKKSIEKPLNISHLNYFHGKSLLMLLYLVFDMTMDV